MIGYLASFDIIPPVFVDGPCREAEPVGLIDQDTFINEADTDEIVSSVR